MKQIKTFLQQLLKEAIGELVEDLKQEYLEEIVYDYYYVNYTISNKKHGIFIRVTEKGNFMYELDMKVRIEHSKSPEDTILFKINSIYKL
jgi:hypothetical protein